MDRMKPCPRCGSNLSPRHACVICGNEDHLLPPADDTALGVRVVRFPDSEMGPFTGYHETDDENLREGDRGLGVLYPGDPRPNVIEVGRWLPLSDTAQQARRDAIAQLDPKAYMLNAGYRLGIDTTLAALGLDAS